MAYLTQAVYEAAERPEEGPPDRARAALILKAYENALTLVVALRGALDAN